jgi:hypothetical protein
VPYSSATSGQRAAGDVDLPGQRLHAVVGHGNAVGVEGVGLQDVGAGGQVLAVDFADHLGLGQHQQVVVALQSLGQSAKRAPR